MTEEEKGVFRPTDHFEVQLLEREFVEMFIPEDTLRQLDDAKQKVAETAGVDVDRVVLKIEMLVTAEI